MPHRVRFIQKINREFDHFIADLLHEDGYETERVYFGITTKARAEEVRRGLRTAGRHNKVSVKAFWQECEGCEDGGESCAYHVLFTAFDPDKAKEYKAHQQTYAEKNTRHPR